MKSRYYLNEIASIFIYENVNELQVKLLILLLKAVFLKPLLVQFNMNIPKRINYLFIVIGGIVAFYAQAQEKQNTFVLIGGVAMLMLGIYGISKNIPSKFDKDETDENDLDA